MLNRGRHLCSARRPSRWALAHILVSVGNAQEYTEVSCCICIQDDLTQLISSSLGYIILSILCSMGNQLPQEKGHSPHLIFGPCLLWPNGWMDEDATLYESRPLRRPHCVRRGPSCPRERGTAPPSFRPMSIVAMVAHLSYC